jgi:hypothetical protein
VGYLDLDLRKAISRECVSHFLPEPANGEDEVKPEERCRSSMHDGIGSSSDDGRGSDISGSADRRFASERILCAGRRHFINISSSESAHCHHRE